MSSVRSRVRLQMDGITRSPEVARAAADTLRAIPGVVDLITDPATGSVAFSYRPPPPATASSAAVEVEVLPRLPVPVARARPSQIGTLATWVVKTVAVAAVEIAVQRALGPLL